MKIHLFFRTLSIIVLICTGFACKGSTGPAGPLLQGEVVGYCRLQDSTFATLRDNSGVIVSAEGLADSATSEKDGRYVLAGVPTGTYTLTFSKSGYGTWKQPGFQLVGGGRIYAGYAYLFQLPNYTATNLSANVAGGSLNIVGYLTGSSNYNRQVVIFIGPTSTVSSNPSTYVSSLTTYVSPGSSTFLAMIDSSSFGYYKVTPGQTVYLVAYGASGWTYQDLQTLKSVYSSLSATGSNVVSVILPSRP